MNVIKYSDFESKVNTIVLKDSTTIKRTYDKTKNKICGIIDNIENMSSEVKSDIVNLLYTTGGDTGILTDKLIKEQGLDYELASRISSAISNQTSKSDFKHEGKATLGKWETKPDDYTGINDEKYGTAFQCTYIKELNLFFVVIDIDAHHSSTDIPINKIESAIPDEYKDTRVINTASNGKHYYYLSQNPPKKNINSTINIDYKTIFANNVEKTIDNSYKTTGKGGYVVASYRWNYNGTQKEQYTHEKTSNNDILIVDNTDTIIEEIINNLHSSDDISTEEYNKFHNNAKTSNIEASFSRQINYELTDFQDAIMHDETYVANNNLQYDKNGIILFKKENSTTLITYIVAEIISMTHGQHNEVLLALEGGLGHMGLDNDTRKQIMFDALELAGDSTKEHKTQIEKSLKRNGDKRGFTYLENNYSHITKHLTQIRNINSMFSNTITNTNYQCIRIRYMELVTQLFQSIEKEEDKKYLLTLIDRYLNMMGMGLNERNRLLISAYNDFQLKGISTVLQDNINNNDDKTYALLSGGEIKLPKEINKQVGKIKEKLNTLATDLDIQISITEKKMKSDNVQPLINLVERPKSLEAYKRRQIAYNFLRTNNCLKKTEEGNYIFDDVKNNSYIPVDTNNLGNFLSMRYPILKMGIESSELETILSMSGEFDELHNEYYLFNNGVLNLHERTFTQTTDFKDYFTIKKMDCDYLSNNQIINPLNSQPTCLVDKVLREILIPKYNEESDIGYYIDFLERLGSVFNTRIKEKKFACYYGDGDNGKDILIEILKMTFADRCLLATMELLTDDKADLSEYDVVIINELDEHSFDDAIAFIKRITGGEEEGTAKRKHYEHGVIKPKNPSAFFLFTNDIPKVPLTETAFYRREDVIKLQNIFKKTPNENEDNEFQADSSLKDKIKKNKEESLEWIVNAGLTAYYDRYTDEGYFKGFTMTQSAEETQMIVSNTDPLSKFLRETYTVDEDQKETISNSEIRSTYENYCMRHDLTCNTSNLAITMGNKIKEVFGDIKKKATNDTLYFLKIKNEDENSIVYYIDTNYNWWDKKSEMPEDTFDAHEKVYNRIKELHDSSTPITKKLLKQEFHIYNIEEILNNLKENDLIFQGKNTITQNE